MSEIKITLIKSLAGQKKRRVATAKSMRLKKINSSTIQPDNDSTLGKIRQINDLITIEKIDDSANLPKIAE